MLRFPAMKFRVTRRDALRGSFAGTQGYAARCAAQALFDAGGRAVLPAPIQSAVRVAVEREASRVLAAVGLLESGATRQMLEGGAARAVAEQTVRAAGRQILRSVGTAAGAGAVIDGGWALVQAARRVRRGSMTHREAAALVAREAATGAAATAAGTTAAILLVALTGGVAAPAVFLVGAAASVGAKAGLDRWLDARALGEVKVFSETAPST
jgi:hypothetical protein